MPPDIKLLDLLFIDVLWSSRQNIFQGVDSNSLVLHCVTVPHFTPLHPSLPINIWRTTPFSHLRRSLMSVNCLRRQLLQKDSSLKHITFPTDTWKEFMGYKINISSGIKNILFFFNFSSTYYKLSHKRAFLYSERPLSILAPEKYKEEYQLLSVQLNHCINWLLHRKCQETDFTRHMDAKLPSELANRNSYSPIASVSHKGKQVPFVHCEKLQARRDWHQTKPPTKSSVLFYSLCII